MVLQRLSKDIQTCRVGPTPTFSEDEPEFIFDSETSDPESSFYSDAIALETKMICTSQTTSQRLAEAHQKGLPTEVEVMKYLQYFVDVFLKESFDTLPSWKVWGHAIDLEPGSNVHPLSPNEQSELDDFLQENMKSGRI